MNYKKEVFGFVFLLLVLVCSSYVVFAALELTSITGDTDTVFEADSSPKCIISDSGAKSEWETFVAGEEDGNKEDSFYDCYRENGISGDLRFKRQMCCPEDHTCEKNESEDYNCVLKRTDPEITRCDMYVNETECGGHNIEDVQDFFYNTQTCLIN
jgi:hypothetical protein